MSDTNADGSPNVEWKRLIDMPTETLASRVVGSFILAKGNLNEYQAIIKNLLDSIAKEHAAVPPEGRTMEMPTASEIRLACGELTAGEMRTVKAALGWFINRCAPQEGSTK